METIKNYLETMFATMPNTPAVLKAKDELLQMMEDKYTELIAEGKTENEAVGAVIQNFGNLEELAEDLGLKKEFSTTKENDTKNPRKHISLEDAKDYITSEEKSGFMIGGAVFMFITCVFWPILFSELLGFNDAIGASLMFVNIGVGIAMIITNNIRKSDWDFITHVPCQIDMMTADYVASEHRRSRSSHTIRVTIGTLLCVFSWIPAAISEEIPYINSNIGSGALFILVGLGVFLIVSSSIRMNAMERLLNLNDSKTVSGQYKKNNDYIVYSNDTIATIMSIYWSTITCVYLIWSFLTFNWYISWIIWPLATIVKHLIDMNFEERN